MNRLAALSIVLCLASTSWAAAPFADDFESYADNTALATVWPLGAGTTASNFLDASPTDPTDQVVRNTTAVGRRDHNLLEPFVVAAGEHTVWQFDYYDFVGSANNPRQYGQFLARNPVGGALTELIAVGQYNAAVPQISSNYQARVAFSSTAVNWFSLTTPRSIGWHTFKVIIHEFTADFYVDGALDTAGVALSAAPHEWYHTRIGSGLASVGGEAAFDNWYIAPEPGSLALLAIGALALRRRR